MSSKAPRTSATRKRKGATNSKSGVKSKSGESKTPVIHDVPPVVVPYLLEAVKGQKAYISMQHKLSQEDDQQSSSSGPLNQRNAANDGRRASDDAIHDAIFARIQALDNTMGPIQELQLGAQRSLKSLLCEITTHTRDVENDIVDDEDLPSGCAVGCLEFLFDLIKDDTSKIILRHAALRVCSGFLQQRNDCRIVYTKKIKELVDAIGDADQHLDAFPKIGKKEHVVVYQQEGLKVIKDVSTRFKTIQPTLVIAGRYLEEQKGISLVAGTQSALKRKTNVGMIELRRMRDVALKFADKETDRIRKLLRKVDSCFETLVPRFGHSSASSDPVIPIRSEDEALNDDKETDLLVVEEEAQSDDDDIDWEDGDNGDNGEELVHSNDKEDHMARVERTLAVMKQSGAIQSGILVVDFDIHSGQSSLVEAPNTDAEADSAATKAREQLSKCIEKLSKRQKRISLWIDAIVSADNMTDSNRIRAASHPENQSGLSSVIILPESIRKKKPSVIRTLTDCKSAISTAISAGKKIGIHNNIVRDSISAVRPEVPDRSNAALSVGPISQPWQDALGVTNARSGTTRRSSHPKVQHSSRNRCRIKLRKS